MGRPIKKRFFGSTAGGTLAGGEAVSSFVVTTQGNNYSQGATITFADSPIGGTTATGTITVWTPQDSTNLSINRTTQTLTNGGSGYLTAPAITVVKPANVTVTASAFSGNLAGNILTVSSTTGLFVGMHQNHANLAQTAHILAIFSGNGNVIMSRGSTSTFVAGQSFQFGDVGRSAVLTATLVAAVTSANTIQANAWTTLGTIGKTADIVSQRSSRRYRVTNADGTSVARLVPTGLNGVNSPTVAQVTAAGGPVAVGQMTIQATDSDGGTYWVGKLESRTALLFPGGTGTPGTQFAANTHVTWTTNLAVASTSVKIATND
jgi:hypothetical protein